MSELLSEIGLLARKHGMTKIAKATGMSRTSLYKALSDDGNPTLDTVLRVLKAMSMRLTVDVAE